MFASIDLRLAIRLLQHVRGFKRGGITKAYKNFNMLHSCPCRAGGGGFDGGRGGVEVAREISQHSPRTPLPNQPDWLIESSRQDTVQVQPCSAKR